MRKLGWLLFPLVFLLSFNAWGARKTADQILKESEAKISALKDVKGKMVQRIRVDDNVVTTTSEIMAKIPDKFYAKIVVPIPGPLKEVMETTCVYDGKVIWYYRVTPEDKSVIKWDLTSEKAKQDIAAAQENFRAIFGTLIPYQLISRAAKEYQLRLLRVKGRGKTARYLIEGVLKEPMKVTKEGPQLPAKVVYEIGVEDGFVYSCKNYDSRGYLLLSIVYKEMKFNTGIPDSQFVFTPPSGVEIFDATELLPQLLSGELGE